MCTVVNPFVVFNTFAFIFPSTFLLSSAFVSLHNLVHYLVRIFMKDKYVLPPPLLSLSLSLSKYLRL